MIKYNLLILILLTMVGCDKVENDEVVFDDEVIVVDEEQPTITIEEQPPEEPVDCDVNLQPTEMFTLRWEHDESVNIEYTLYYSSEPITDVVGINNIKTTDKYIPFDPIAMNIENCTTLYFRVSASYITCPVMECSESALSNEISRYIK